MCVFLEDCEFSNIRATHNVITLEEAVSLPSVSSFGLYASATLKRGTVTLKRKVQKN